VIDKYEFHDACLALPKMAEDEYLSLRRSVKSDGYDKRHPILLHQGKILDGRHRYLACIDEGIAPVFMQWAGGDPFDFVRREHEARRSWRNQEQKALVVGDLLDQSAAWADEQQRIKDEANRKRAEAAKGHEFRGNQHQPIEVVVPQVEARPPTKPSVSPPPAQRPQPNRTTTAKAASIGVSRPAVERAEMIKRNSPALAKQVAQGEITATKAIQEIRRTAQTKALEEVAAREVEKPTGLYDVIVIDPPWPMVKIERDVRPNQVAFEYPTMDEAELAALKIPADADCHVWLWTTHKFMPMAFKLLDAWGLKYVCTFVWHKPGGFQPIGLPQFNCEFALYARKGTPKFLDTKALPTCFNAPRGAHSEKPEEFYDVVRRVTGGRRLDMFNRRMIDGFTGWGKEMGK
jgi:N6-adenosine-specific RNA methylase IME4